MTPDDTLALALTFTLPAEGGYQNDPRDPGNAHGGTNHGITQATYTNWLAEHSMPDADIRQISVQEVNAIYRELFWLRPKFDAIAVSLPATAIATFDWYLNGSVKMELAAIMGLQRRLGVIADGSIGPMTIAAASKYASDYTLAIQLCQDRQAYDDIHTGAAFIHGITNRIEAMKEFLEKHFSGQNA